MRSNRERMAGWIMRSIERNLERMRGKLYMTISHNGFRLSADEVLRVSGKLDELILDFYKDKDQSQIKRQFPAYCRE